MRDAILFVLLVLAAFLAAALRFALFLARVRAAFFPVALRFALDLRIFLQLQSIGKI